MSTWRRSRSTWSARIYRRTWVYREQHPCVRLWHANFSIQLHAMYDRRNRGSCAGFFRFRAVELSKAGLQGCLQVKLSPPGTFEWCLTVFVSDLARLRKAYPSHFTLQRCSDSEINTFAWFLAWHMHVTADLTPDLCTTQ